ncbi:MAG: Trk system potassium transporter TrkA [Ignavibacteriales bacterium]|nr:Trk system potassium transporter TrkA [Ignavibacteriales bacterium]
MNIVIAGAGEVGYHLVKQLSNEEYNISVIDPDSSRLDKVSSIAEVMTIKGSATCIEILEKAKISNTDLLVAVTASQCLNYNICTLGKKLGAEYTISRVSSREYSSEENKELFNSLGIDYVVYPEELASLEIVKLIERAAATDVLEFEGGTLSLIGLKLDRTIPVLRKTMREVALEYNLHDFRIVAIHRGVRTIIPKGEDIFLPNDQIFVITKPNGVEDILRLSGKENTRLENIMILGGGKIGRKTARLLENRLNVKLIESNQNKVVSLASDLENTLIIQGDGRDLDLLAQEGIIDMDGFLAVTEEAETNIITCLMAKHLGVKKTIAQVDNVDYIPLTQTIGLDALVNQKLITANNISKVIRKAKLISIATLQGVDAEVVEYIAKPGSKVTKKPVKELDFPENAIIGGYVRDGEGYIAIGSSQLKANDKVVVFALPGAIRKAEKYFE